MRILITTTLNRNMTEAKLKPLCMLDDLEHIFYVCDTPGPYFEKVTYYAVPQWACRISNNNSFVRWAFKFFLLFYLAVIKRPDVVMGYAFIPHGINVVLIGRFLGIPACINFMGGRFLIEHIHPLLMPAFLKIARLADIITVTGSCTRDLLISKGLDANKIHIISSAIDTKRFFPTGSEKRYDVITVAELAPWKRIDMFLDIVAGLKREGINVKALIAGDGPLRPSLERLSMDIGLGDAVYFAGFQPDIERYLNESKVFVLPTAHEGLSLAMLEAMACGVVPIVSNVDNLSDAVKQGFNGILIDKDDTQGFISGVRELLEADHLYDAYSRNCVGSIDSYYTISDASKKWEKALAGIRRPRNAWNWYVKRLMAMSAGELIYRSIRGFRSKILYLKALYPGLSIFAKSENLRRPVFFIDDEDVDFISNVQLRRLDKSSRRSWTRGNLKEALSSLITFDRTAISDIKRRAGFSDFEIRHIWERNRFQWLVPYAQLYAMNKDEGLALDILAVLNEWMDKNPFMKTVNWMDSMEASLRLLSWTWVYFLIKGSVAMEGRLKDLFMKGIYLHAAFIENNLSMYSSANNHIIGEATGLFTAGVMFPELIGSDRWMKKARIILEREIDKQIYPDGVSKEQSSHYHGLVTDLYLLAVIMARRNSMSFSDNLFFRLEKMVEFLKHIMGPDGRVLSIGDSDDGLAIRFNISKDVPNAVSMLNTASVIFNRPDFKMYSHMDEKSLWLLGREGHDRYCAMQDLHKEPSSICFPEAGYCIMRHQGLFVNFDCGELGYLSLASHGHADSLHITLNMGSMPILVDPGTYLYHSGGKWRDYFRGTSGHNTIRVDGVNQSEIEGPFLWGYKARSYLKEWSLNCGIDKAAGYHTGYTRLKDPVLHTREVQIDKSSRQLIITDMLSCKKQHFIEQFFHLHPDCSLNRVDTCHFKIVNKDAVLIIEIDPRFFTEIFIGSEEPVLGWYSGLFGERRRAITIRNSAYSEGDKNFLTRIKL